MDARINYLLRDGNALKGTVDTNRAAMDEGGFDAEGYTEFTTAITDLKTKESAQQTAKEAAEAKTAEQKIAVEKVRDLIRDVRLAAQSAFVNDARVRKSFTQGENIPTSMASLVPLCNKLNALIDERKDALIKKGFTQSKINQLIAAPADLDVIDKVQENAKKLKKAKTIERNAATKKLRDEMASIRNFAEICFAKKPEILVLFEPIPKGRGGSGGEDEGGENGNQTPPENTEPPAS